MGFDSLSSKEEFLDTWYDLSNLQKNIAQDETLQVWLSEDYVCKELEKNDSILWNEKFPKPIPDDIIGKPSAFWWSKTASFELTWLLDMQWKIMAYVSIWYVNQEDWTVYVNRRITFKVWNNPTSGQYTGESKIYLKFLKVLEKHALEFLPKKSEEVNEYTWKSLWMIHYLPNSK